MDSPLAHQKTETSNPVRFQTHPVGGLKRHLVKNQSIVHY